MKRVMRNICLLLIISLVLLTAVVYASPGDLENGELRGVWVATVANIDYPSKATADSEVLKNEAIGILDNAESMGLNAVFLQVRPTSDAIYKSKLFPWSKYLTGCQGQAPSNAFDPLDFWISEAHKRGIELHAWINPYRITKKTSGEKKHDFSSLSAANPAKLKPEWVVKYSDGNLYYNPGIPEVRKLVIDGVLEIVNNYNVDGIHFDDYFYPGKDFDDKAAFSKYGAGYSNIHDWRRANVNTLIRELSAAIKAAPADVSFGISPFGIWANKSVNNLGSDTSGMQSYYDQYADTRKWVKDGLLDYIAPQLYWNIGYKAADYSKLLSWWQNTTAGTGVDLYIGQGAYRAGNSDPASPWFGVAEMEKQLQLNSQNPEVKGSIFFSNKSLVNNPALSAVIKAVYEKKDSSAAVVPVSISRPSENIRTRFEQYYLNGCSDPNKPLLLNGKPVAGRSAKGYFGVLVPLSIGANVFTFSQEGSDATRVIYRDAASVSPAKMSKAEILPGSTFPKVQEYRSPGEKITLSCNAPAGAKVTVKIGGKSYPMKPSESSGISGLYADTYTYVYTVPGYSGAPRNIDLGEPVYTMNYKGTISSRKAEAKVGVIMNESPFYALVEKSVIYTYNSPASAGGAAYELQSGMTDYVTGMSDSYVRLSSGQWVNKSDVKLYNSKTRLRPAIKRAVYNTGEKWDSLKLEIASPVAAIADFDGASLNLNISAASSAPLPILPADAPFTSAAVSRDGNKVKYTLTLKNNHSIEGYYIEKTAAGLVLNIKRPVKAKEGNEPLLGMIIMLDPGHGGSDYGAVGPLGLRYPEKTINLNTALKLQSELERLGARVVMTRTTDVALSLEERLAASRSIKPDMFISIHANSMADNVDITKVDGFSVFYRENHSKSLAESIFAGTLGTMKRNSKGIHNKNFYVIRGTWTNSVLLESGFVPNPTEFEWLIDSNEQVALAKSYSEAIVKYLKK